MKIIGKIAVLAALAAVSLTAGAQAFPSKTVRFIVPYPTGGGYDQLARAMAPKLSELWGQPVVVENRAGANEIVATQAVKTADPDGHTIMMAGTSTMITNELLHKSIPYDPRTDLTPITKLLDGSMLYTVRPSLNVNSINEFIEYARQAGGKANYGSSGVGGLTHTAMAWMGVRSGVDLIHVAYKGSAPIITDMIGGTIDATVAPPNMLVSHVKAGSLRPIGVSGKTRLKALPDVPTVYETGNEEFAKSFFVSIVAPANTPKATVDRIANDFRRVACDPEFARQHGDPYGFTMTCDSPEAFQSFLEEQRQIQRKQIEATGIRID